MSHLSEESDDSLGSDGDDVQLRILRKEKKEGRVSMKLGTPNPRPLFNRPPAPTIEAKNENKIARLARSIRRAVDIEDESQVKSLLKKAKKYKPVSELAIDPENNKENVWHYALSNKKNGIADYLLNANDVTLLQSHYEVEEAGIKGDRNALHILIIQEEVEKVKTLLDKIILPTERRNMIIKETPFKKYPMQRPRLMSCLHLAAYHGFNELVELFIKDMNDSDVNKVTGNKDTALMWAARLGKDDTVDTLIKNNADPNIQDDKHSTALYWAVRYGHVKTVDILLRANASPNITRTEGLVAPLIAASAYGYNDIVERLLADPNVRNKINTIKGLGGKTPLHYAAREGNIDVLNTLLKNGALLNVEDIQGNTPLLSAAQRKYNSHVVYELITRPDPDSPHGAKDLDLQRNSEGRNVWNYAIDSKDTDLLKTLVAACKNTNKDISRRQPLFIAAERGRSDMIHVLLHLQQDPLSINAKGNTFLHIAAMHDKSDVIDEFHTKVSINTPNNDKDTPLHIACGNGCDKTIKTLLKYKAKADVMNSQLETALHVAAKKNRITPDTARELVCYTKNSHTWECLNAKDSNENNCLHLAGEYAEPNVIWEFRSVRLDQNEDGHTPLHKAVRAGQPEALDMMLKIVETMHREAAINIPSNKKRETVLHLAADAGLSSCVKRLIDLGADLSLQDAEGNTVLHRLTIATIKNQRHIKRHLEVFDTILGMVVKWWCKNMDIECPDGNSDNYKDLRKEAASHLIYEIPNNKKLSVIALSFKLGASEIIHRLLMMLDITMLEKPDHIYRFDVSALKPLTNIANSKKSNRKCCGCGANNQVSDLNPQSGLEYLIELKEKTRAAEILDIPSMKRIEEYYNSIAFRTFLLLTILHVVYMSIFTYVGVDLLAKLRDDNRTIDSSYLPVLMLCIVPIEPFLIGLYLTTLLCNLIKDIKSGKKECKCGTLNFWRVIELLLYLLYAAIVIIWIVLFSARCNFQDYVLAAALCIGWLLSIKLTKGFRQIHYFSRMLGSMILNDFVRFAVIYVFVLFAFGSAFHVLFQISWDIVQVYQTPLDTIFLSFNLMTGRGELFDDDFEENMTDAGRDLTYVKIYYLIYVLLSSIILINLLIAMMNDSYKKILTDQQVMWRIESVKLGVGTEAMLCDFLRKKISSLSSVTIVSEGEGKSKRWFIDIDCEEVREFMNQRDIETENKDTKLSSRLEELEMKINEILKKTNSLQQQQNDIADERHKMTTLNTTANK